MVAISIRLGWEHMFVRQTDVIDRALRLARDGHSDYEVSRRTGVPRSTIQRWRHRRPAGHHILAWQLPDDKTTYAYLLGVFLGDGCIGSTGANSACLHIYLDAAHPGVIAEVSAAMKIVCPGRSVRRYDRPGTRTVHLYAAGRQWLSAFPQHGPGRKHLRPIVLTDWQEAVVAAHPRELIRGLIHSDGCRCINRFKTKLPSGRVAEYAYPRYFFSNLSVDIRGIFCDACDRLDIRWSWLKPRNISISHRDSVALLDEFVGPKS